ncbi:MAG: ABC transporter substrate-binding protein [Thermodesulfobacteriota bacterium]
MPLSVRTLFPGAILCLLALLSGCQDQGSPAPELTYRLKWLYNISVAGDLYGQEHGIFAKHGLAVAVKPGGPERDAIKELEIGRAQFGVASADQVIRARAKGAPIVVIAQLFQGNPLQWIHRGGKERFATPQDLRGKTVGITYGGNDETIMRALLAKHGIESEALRLFSVRYDYTPFYRGEVDLWPIYRNAEGIVIGERLARAGETTDFFAADDFGIRFVANSVLTTRKMIEEKPETVRAFRRALLEAWQAALAPANKEKTVALVHRFDQDTPKETIARQLVVTRELMLTKERPFGRIDIPAWQQSEKIMVEQGLIDAPVLIERALLPE